MRDALLPLFPLNVVLFPRTFLPLHIFEDRYKEMMAEILETDGEFGVVLARSNRIVSTGCTAGVEKVLERYEDGQLDILAIGRRRFEISLVNEQKSYLQAGVEFFDDEQELELPTLEQRALVLDGFYALQKIESEVVIGKPSLDDPQLSFQLAQIIDDLDFRQRLLQVRQESIRIQMLAEFLPPLIERKQLAARMRKLSVTNGHGPLPGNLSA